MKEKNIRTIESILDLETGKNIDSDSFFKNNPETIFKFRSELESDIQSKQKRYVCYYCKQNVKVRGQVGAKLIMHFAHLKDSEDCPIKTNNKYTKEQIERIKYNGAKESFLHNDLKNKIAHFLKLNELSSQGVEDVQIETVFKDKAIPTSWKKPDISSLYHDEKLVIELQLSTTFLSVIVQRQEFYKKNNTFILWVFSHFEDNIEKRKFTQSDIFYNNNQNGFEFNEEAQKQSFEKNDLILCCHYAKPFIENQNVFSGWEIQYVSLSDLTFDKKTYQVYFYNYELEKAHFQEIIELKQSVVLDLVANRDISSLFDYFSHNVPSNIEIRELTKLFKETVIPLSCVLLGSFEYRIIWSIIAAKIKDKYIFREVVKDHVLKKIIIDILSLKLNKIIGYDFIKQIQIAHNLFDRHPQYSDYYQKAMNKYNNIGNDKNNKLAKKMENIRLKGIEQISYNKALDLIFTDL